MNENDKKTKKPKDPKDPKEVKKKKQIEKKEEKPKQSKEKKEKIKKKSECTIYFDFYKNEVNKNMKLNDKTLLNHSEKKKNNKTSKKISKKQSKKQSKKTKNMIGGDLGNAIADVFIKLGGVGSAMTKEFNDIININEDIDNPPKPAVSNPSVVQTK